MDQPQIPGLKGATEDQKCTLSNYGIYEYCNNVGNQIKNGENFECQQCEHGSYYRKHDMLRGYQTVKTLPTPLRNRIFLSKGVSSFFGGGLVDGMGWEIGGLCRLARGDIWGLAKGEIGGLAKGERVCVLFIGT
jgi:hypothetical protein